MLGPDQIRANLIAVERRIVAACDRSGRRREGVTLVAVAKTFPAAAVEAAIAAGATDIGENRVQEARDKKPAVSGLAHWHLIGHLQSNKAKDAVRLFDVIHSIDSPSLAGKTGRAAAAAGKRQDVLIEVNIAGEPQKAGALPADVPALTAAIRAIDSLSLLGLMAIPPLGDPEATRPHFRSLRNLKEDLGLHQLSMGMTDDFEVAIEEGATILRVGRAIFGSRG
ncbi:MAG TPA: YggS family pyridoxal phosphate-dependent enzyme [Thermoanaerobaculia bacterium]|nr:YggS family pyridoxal phosphate-dependent enzyme [Thermoanaerobaculia bacterium]